MEDNNMLPQPKSLLDRIILFCLKNKLVVTLMVLAILLWGLMVAPFDWNLGGIPRDQVPVDAIPDIGENQQIVFTNWMGRSPQDVEDQISYPLTVSLLGVPGVKTVRSYSMFGFSSIYVIFKDNVDFYWSRSRILEKLNSLSAATLPEGVQPTLGPDATALGQVYWYTLEGRDEKGNASGGWDLQELRTIQDWYVRYSLLSADGISEVASVGGFVREYQIDVDPDALRANKVSLDQVFMAVKMSNLDVGARTIEINKVEYMIRGLGFIKNLADIENSVVKVNANIPIYIKNIAKVTLGPALRRGALDKEGTEAVGGVVVVRYGDNPLAAIKNLKKKIAEISPGLPKKTLADGTVSQVKIVPFYDRSGLINETLETLNTALTEEILVTIIVVLIMLLNLRSSILIAGLLPLAVLMAFIAMRYFGVDANIVALSGIAIAIGTMVDMGIVIVENIIKHLDQADPGENRLNLIYRATSEVGSAVITAVSTTVVSFLPVFTMVAAEGKLFKPLAFTKSFALVASIIIAITIIPPYAQLLFSGKVKKGSTRVILNTSLMIAGIFASFMIAWWFGLILILVGAYQLWQVRLSEKTRKKITLIVNYAAAFIIAVILTKHWLPLGPEKGVVLNLIFVATLIGGILAFFNFFQRVYGRLLTWFLRHKTIFFSAIMVILFFGAISWLGFLTVFSWLPGFVKKSPPVSYISHKFPGLGKEFMPPLDEGAFLYMPTTMPHASIGEVLDVLKKQDMAFTNIPEIDSAVGKLGRADTPLDPAPISMIETVINYKPQYLVDNKGRRIRFRFSTGVTDFFRDEAGNKLPGPDGMPYIVRGKFSRDKQGKLIPDNSGYPFRLWRPELDPVLNAGRKRWAGIYSANDIWAEIVEAGKIPGTTSAPRLQPIAARIVMLQSGMRAPMGIKIKGPDLATIEKVGMEIEKLLKDVPAIEPSAVIADRIIGKPYLEIEIDREAIARYGIMLRKVQDVIEVAIGGMKITTTVEGRERYPVRVRYPRELRGNLETLAKIYVTSPSGQQIPLTQLAKINYVRGPQVIKSEDTFLVGYVLFDMKPGLAEVEVVEAGAKYLQQKIESGELVIPAGVSYTFSGSYENQVRSEKKLMIVLPLALFIIFLILYFQFGRVSTTFLVFFGIAVAWSGGFIMIWLYGQPWFLDFSIFGVHLQNLFQIHPIHLSVAVWVGFLALFGIASDDGVIIATYLDQVFARETPKTVAEVREATVRAGLRRVRPAVMTIGTTILALLPVLTSTGRGADIMVPMAIPTFGGMCFALLTVFTVPVSYCWLKERQVKKNSQ
ncbi:MAG: efflux RND transporter permease subunit [Candidatus Aminicenantes bacterium]|nr:efflux RND transporter permease subunit [Acidobacteriota bacterium]MBU4404635.1 efflux RND transporter permease subunit [Acidobacteriota bacterium]MCG2810235.1 efflux RND transporter permease subunit [Candidatus Aminicenantes bacterium]